MLHRALTQYQPHRRARCDLRTLADLPSDSRGDGHAGDGLLHESLSTAGIAGQPCRRDLIAVTGSHGRGHRSESCTAHHKSKAYVNPGRSVRKKYGKILHGRGCKLVDKRGRQNRDTGVHGRGFCAVLGQGAGRRAVVEDPVMQPADGTRESEAIRRIPREDSADPRARAVTRHRTGYSPSRPICSLSRQSAMGLAADPSQCRPAQASRDSARRFRPTNPSPPRPLNSSQAAAGRGTGVL